MGSLFQVEDEAILGLELQLLVEAEDEVVDAKALVVEVAEVEPQLEAEVEVVLELLLLLPHELFCVSELEPHLLDGALVIVFELLESVIEEVVGFLFHELFDAVLEVLGVLEPHELVVGVLFHELGGGLGVNKLALLLDVFILDDLLDSHLLEVLELEVLLLLVAVLPLPQLLELASETGLRDSQSRLGETGVGLALKE